MKKIFLTCIMCVFTVVFCCSCSDATVGDVQNIPSRPDFSDNEDWHVDEHGNVCTDDHSHNHEVTPEEAPEGFLYDNPTDTSKPAPVADIDLTVMSNEEALSYMTQMVEEPAEFVDKVIKVKGIFEGIYFEETEMNYYFVSLFDDDGCSQSLELVFEGMEFYPHIGPEINTEFTVTGTYRPYLEGDHTYYHLEDTYLEF